MLGRKKSKPSKPTPTTDELVAREVKRQDMRWPPFTRERASMRLGIACLEDEVREVRIAHEEDRHDDFCGLGFTGTTDELVQVAAVATRLARDIRGR